MTSININSPSHRRYFFRYGDFPGYHERNNHIAIFTPAIFKKTVLKYFELVGKEYFTSPSIFTGAKGALRKIIYRMCKGNDLLKQKIEERWGPKIAYILRKP